MFRVSNHYFYEGPVYIFNTLVQENWIGETFAVTKEKAKSNLEYQYKKMNGYQPNAVVRLDPRKVDMIIE